MRSPVEAPSTAFGRGSDLLEQVDYRLAETPEEKEEIYKPPVPRLPSRRCDQGIPDFSAIPINMTISRTPGRSASIFTANSTVRFASAVLTSGMAAILLDGNLRRNSSPAA